LGRKQFILKQNEKIYLEILDRTLGWKYLKD
jgi:hypothetical protein